MSSQDYDYHQLIEVMRDRARTVADPSPAVLANHESALKGFLNERGIDPSEKIGATLRTQCDRHFASHLAALKANADRRYRANRKSLMKKWRKLVADLDHQEAAVKGQPAPFTVELRRPFEAGASQKGTAKMIGMPLATLKRLLKRGLPTRRTMRYVPRLERVFGMAPGHLSGLLPAMDQVQEKATASSVAASKTQKKSPKRLVAPAEVTEEFRQEWTALKNDKTQSFIWEEEDSIPDDIEDIGRPWGLIEIPPGKQMRHPWISVVGDQSSGSARHAFDTARTYLGWLQLAREDGGLGMMPNDAQHLGHFADRQMVRAYVFWWKKKKEFYTRSCIRFLSMASMLCRSPTGFLFRHPEFGRPVGVTSPEVWEAKCKQTLALIVVMRRDISSKLVVRDTAKKLKGALASTNPIRAFGEAIMRHKARKPASGDMAEAIWARDLVMLYIIVSCPLRLRNLVELIYVRAGMEMQNNMGRLRRTAGGEWLIEIPRERLKNGAYKEALEAAVVKSGWGFLDRYFRDYRSTFGPSAYVFASRKGDDSPWDGLSNRFKVITGRNLEGCDGIGTQAARHLVASGLSRRFGSSAASAVALHDSERTVDDHYILDDPRRAADVLDELLNGRGH